jgi:FkbM family methyltransferase
MDSRLVSDKLLSAFSQPLPLLGYGLVDRLKLGLISLMALLALPFLFVGNQAYGRATTIINHAAPKGFTIRTAFGTFYCRNYDDLLVVWPPYEAELNRFFSCDPQSVFIDVGAHVGRYTVMLAPKVKRVFSIEPNTDNFRILLKNIELNNLCNISTLKVACWDEVGLNRNLFLSSSPGKHSFLKPQSQFEQVETTNLDRVVVDLHILPSEVGLLKIDAEGAELEILKGGKELLTSGHPKVIFEAFPQHEKNAADLLRTYGYEKIRRVGEINFVAEK